MNDCEAKGEVARCGACGVVINLPEIRAHFADRHPFAPLSWSSISRSPVRYQAPPKPRRRRLISP
jgi:hypothetical protein